MIGRLLALGLFLLSAPAFGQGNVQSSGTLVPGHVAKWATAGAVIADGGGAAGSATANKGYVTELGITNTGLPLCINDALISGGYHALCFGANSLGGGLIAYNAFNGADPLPLQIEINGTFYPFPGTVTGMPSVASNTVLKTLPHTYAPVIMRQDVEAGYGAPAMPFVSSANACSIPGGDEGSQVPTSDGGCWLGQFSYTYDIREFKALAGLAYDSGPSIRAAVAAASLTGGAVYVPSNGIYSILTSVTGIHPWGTCIAAPNNLHMMGDRIAGPGSKGSSANASRIWCAPDADGISTSGPGRVNNPLINDLVMVGNAANSTLPNQTACITYGIGTDWTPTNLTCQNFVDGIHDDHSVSGGGGQQVLSNVVVNAQDGYPNAINGYPRFGWWAHGASGQTQDLKWNGGQLYVGTQIVSAAGYVGDNSQTQFSLDLSNIGPGFYFYGVDGLKVRVQDTTGAIVTKSLGVQYTVSDGTSGSPAPTVYGQTVTGTFAQRSNTITFPTPARGLPSSIFCSGTSYYSCLPNLRVTGYDIPPDAVVTSLSSGGGTTAMGWISPSNSLNFTGSIAPVSSSFTGSITSNVLTVPFSSTPTNPIIPGAALSGSGITAGTTIVQQLTGTDFGAGTYQVSIPQSASSTTVTASYGLLTASPGVSLYTTQNGWNLTGGGVTAGTVIERHLTATTAYVNISQTIGPIGMTALMGTDIGATETIQIAQFNLAGQSGCGLTVPPQVAFSSSPVTSNCAQKLNVTFDTAPPTGYQITLGYVDPWAMAGLYADGGGASLAASNNAFDKLGISGARYLISDNSGGRNQYNMTYAQISIHCGFLNAIATRMRVTQSSSFTNQDGCADQTAGPFSGSSSSGARSQLAMDAVENTTAPGWLPRNQFIGADFTTNPWPNGQTFTNIGSTPTSTAPGWCGYTATGNDLTIANGGSSSIKVQRQSGSSDTSPKVLCYEVPAPLRLSDIPGTIMSWGLNFGADYSGGPVTMKIVGGTGSNEGWAAMIAGTWTGYTDIAEIRYDGGNGATIVYPFAKGWNALADGTPITELGIMWSYVPSGTAGANDYFRLSIPQLESGQAATSFETKSVSQSADEVAQLVQTSYNGVAAGTANGSLSTEEYAYVQFTGAMSGQVKYPKAFLCTSPTLTLYSPITGASGKLYSSTLPGDRTISTSNIGDVSGNTATKLGFKWKDTGSDTAGQYVSFHWRASCETL